MSMIHELNFSFFSGRSKSQAAKRKDYMRPRQSIIAMQSMIRNDCALGTTDGSLYSGVFPRMRTVRRGPPKKYGMSSAPQRVRKAKVKKSPNGSPALRKCSRQAEEEPQSPTKDTQEYHHGNEENIIDSAKKPSALPSSTKHGASTQIVLEASKVTKTEPNGVITTPKKKLRHAAKYDAKKEGSPSTTTRRVLRETDDGNQVLKERNQRSSFILKAPSIGIAKKSANRSKVQSTGRAADVVCDDDTPSDCLGVRSTKHDTFM
jgi:hypothetical protein